ncbi:homing endonuclease [uncultured phage cr149_1]|uniref:Intron endonuclease GIY-YIG domain of bacteriophage T4 endonuclease n=1 Tax=uncultured phage cr149_1 TaxID=2986412 RepID=A0AAE7RV65_9CAUD|nr:homing endonuclease [uncultured phage cr149_1]QWM89295.1 intron endonuclease GIY-YIG domain of bacteriophage T4 endonuclease [uncultured phage cr149_1]
MCKTQNYKTMNVIDIKDEKIYEIYKITDKINDKVYIGATSQGCGKRFKQHIWKANEGSNYAFHKAIRDIGENNFEVETIEYLSSLEELKQREKYWIIQYRSMNPKYGYNSDCGGDIMFHTEETKAKISKIHKGKDQSSRYKAVLQYDENGKFIREYPSLTHASEFTNICRASLIRGLKHVFKGRSKVNPFIWVYKEDYPDVPSSIDTKGLIGDINFERPISENFIKARNSNLTKDGKMDNLKKSVIQYDLQGNVLEEFDSISEASRITGVSNTTIRDYCNGKFNTRLSDPKFLKRIKYIWKYKQ